MTFLAPSHDGRSFTLPRHEAVSVALPKGSPPDAAPRSEPSEIVSPGVIEDIRGLRQEWLALAMELPHSSYFQTPDWVLGWWDTVAGRPPTTIAVWRGAAGTLEAIAAVSHVRQPLHRRIRLSVPTWINAGAGIGAADHCGWLARSHRHAAAEQWLLAHTKSGPLLLHNVDPEVGAVPLAGARPVQHTRCPRLRVSTDDREMGWSANFRQQLRSRERKLRGAGVTMEWIDPPDMNERVLDSLFALHHDRWSRRQLRSNFTGEQKPLHNRLIEAAARNRGPAAVVATAGGRTVGVLYGFWWKDVFAYYQMGWDQAYAEHGLGTVLLREGIRMTAARGGRVFDFLRGTEPVKYRFHAQDRTDTTWLVPRGWPGGLLALSFGGRRFFRSLRDRWPLVPEGRPSYA